MEKNNKFFAVLDTETNWSDQVMSIGIVIANADTFEAVHINIIYWHRNTSREVCIPEF